MQTFVTKFSTTFLILLLHFISSLDSTVLSQRNGGDKLQWTGQHVCQIHWYNQNYREWPRS